MDDYFPFIVVGLTTGSVFAVAAMGLTVTYTTSGVFNFAHGAVAMVATYVYYSLHVDLGLPTAAAMAVAVLGVGPVVGLCVDRLLFRRLHGAPAATYVVVSLGLLIALQGLIIIIYGADLRPLEPIFPRETFGLAGVRVGYDQAIVVAISVVVALALAVFFKRSSLGVKTRAVVDDPNLTELVGVNSSLVTTFSWMLGCSFAALSGLLLAPLVGSLDAVFLTLLVIQSFGAAVVGRLVDLRWTYLGGLGIGVAAEVSKKIFAGEPSLSGLPTSLPFIVLLAVLVLSRRGRFTEVVKISQRVTARQSLGTRPFPWATIGLGTVIAVGLGFTLDGAPLLTAAATVIFVLLFSSLSLLVGLSRQVSLSHAVFFVIGATTLSGLQDAGVPYLLALLLSGAVLVPIGACVAIPALRLSGLFLALGTFAFGILGQQLLYTTVLAGAKATRVITRPEFLGVSLKGDRAFYLFVVAVVLTGVVAVEIVRVTRLGRMLRALADSPAAVQILGVNPMASQVLVFCLSAFLAGIAGALIGTLTAAINAEAYGFLESLIWVTVLIAAGRETLLGTIVAAVLLFALPSVFTSPTVREWQPVAFGLGAIVLAQAPNGLVGLLRPRWPQFARLAAASRWRLEDGPLRHRLAEGAR